MAYETVRDIGHGWTVLQDRSKDNYRVLCGGMVVMNDMPGAPHGRALMKATPEDLDAALQARSLNLTLGQDVMLHFISHAVQARGQAAKDGLKAGMQRAKLEAAVANSEPFRLLKSAVRKMTGATTATYAGPWLVGVVPGTARKADRMVSVYPWTMDRLAHAEIISMAEALGLPLTSQPNATGARTSYMHVLAPRATFGVEPNSAIGVQLEQDRFHAAMREAAVHIAPDGRVRMGRGTTEPGHDVPGDSGDGPRVAR